MVLGERIIKGDLHLDEIDPASSPPPTLSSQPRAPATTEAYQRDFAGFDHWCQTRGIAALPAAPQMLAAYLAS